MDSPASALLPLSVKTEVSSRGAQQTAGGGRERRGTETPVLRAQPQLQGSCPPRGARAGVGGDAAEAVRPAGGAPGLPSACLCVPLGPRGLDETPAYGATSAPLKPPTQMRSSSRISLALTRTLVSHSRTCTCAHTPELTLTRAQCPLAHGHARELMLEYTRVCVRGGHTGREQRDQPPGALDRPPSQLLPLWRRCLLACPHRPPRTRPRAVPRLWYREPWPCPRCVQVCKQQVPGGARLL